MLEKLKELIGKPFQYKGKSIFISKVKQVGTSYVVFTNRQTMNFFESEVESFISEIKQSTIPQSTKEYTPMEKKPSQQEKTTLVVTSDIKTTLLETMQKVKTDKSYINQANAICNITSQMINILKVEIQILNFKNNK